MLDDDGETPAAAGATPHVKRYAPPNQRNWSNARHKSSGDGLERANRGNEVGRNFIGTKGGSLQGIGEYHSGENLNEKLIPLHGCCNSRASELLSSRWAAAMSAFRSLPDDSPEKPVMYKRNHAAPWSQGISPHLITSLPGGTSCLQRDFLNELRQAMDNAES